MTIALTLVLAAVVYAWGVVRVARAGVAFPRFAPWAFGAALLSVAAVLFGPMDTLSDASLSWHMVQHLVLISVTAPLLLFGAPVRLALAALPTRAASQTARVLGSAPLRIVGHPLFGLGFFIAVLYGTHFSPLYERALENETVHAGEHVLYLTAGVLYWMPIFTIAPAPYARPHAVRILALFLTLPASAFLGFAFYITSHVLYPHYAARPGALADQMNAGAVMWLSAGTPVLLAMLWCVADWGARERRLDHLYDASEAGRP